MDFATDLPVADRVMGRAGACYERVNSVLTFFESPRRQHDATRRVARAFRKQTRSGRRQVPARIAPPGAAASAEGFFRSQRAAAHTQVVRGVPQCAVELILRRGVEQFGSSLGS